MISLKRWMGLAIASSFLLAFQPTTPQAGLKKFFKKKKRKAKRTYRKARRGARRTYRKAKKTYRKAKRGARQVHRRARGAYRSVALQARSILSNASAPAQCRGAVRRLMRYAIRPNRAGCNGYKALCNKPYDKVFQLSTHNSFAAIQSRYNPYFANHCVGMMTQLKAGIRSFMIDLHHWNGRKPGRRRQLSIMADFLTGKRGKAMVRAGQKDPGRPVYLCHDLCFAGSQKLIRSFRQIRSWMARNRREVVTFILQAGNVSAASFKKALVRSGLWKYVYHRTQACLSNAKWPTLGHMVRTNKRLVILAGRSGDKPGNSGTRWYLGESCTWENKYAAKNVNQLRCTHLRGSGQVNIINHFLTHPLGSPHLASRANSLYQLRRHYQLCKRRGRTPTHYAVDYVSLGSSLAFARSIYAQASRATARGSAVRSKAFALYPTWDMPGNDLRHFRAGRLSLCQAACARERRCFSFAFNKSSGYCWLKRTRSGRRLLRRTYVWGVKRSARRVRKRSVRRIRKRRRW